MAEPLRRAVLRGRVLRALIAVMLAGAAGAAAYFFRDTLFPKATAVVIRNESGKTLSLVELVMRHPSGAVTTERFSDLAPDGQCVVHPLALDFTARLTFVMADGERVHEEGVDLWAGETFAFEIQPDGSVRAGHDYGPEGGD